MNKEEYAMLHYLLAKLRYELEISLMECDCNSKYAKQLRNQIEKLNEVSKIFIIDNE